MAKPFPWYYAVNDRPVKIVQLPDGGADALVLDWATGAFTPDRRYVEKVSGTGIGKDVDQLTESEFDQLVSELRRPISARRTATAIRWEHTSDAEFPYRVLVDGHTHTIRINDFPAEPLFTLLIDGQEIEDLEDWPRGYGRRSRER